METLLFKPRPASLIESRIRRLPTRPPAHRPPDFDERFDAVTLLYDSFFRGSNEVFITAPPFFNLLPFLQRMDVIAVPSGQKCRFRIRNMDRHSRIRITVPTGTTAISLRTGIGQFDLEPQEDVSEFFAGKRVLFTKSKDNRLEWILDWISYHRDIHGANAVLFYDNQSTRYSTADLLSALSRLAGIDRLCIAHWPFLFGPQGFGAKRFWDSDFCEYGIWEHARWMFLGLARSALGSDVDELVVSKDGSSAFEQAERSRLGAIRYKGHWVHGFKGLTRTADDSAPIRVVDFDHYLQHLPSRRWGIVPERESVCPPKWTVVPRRCPERAQWTPHRIKGWIGGLPINRNFSYRHFREISIHWKYDRSAREVFDPDLYKFDELMRSNFSAVQWAS